MNRAMRRATTRLDADDFQTALTSSGIARRFDANETLAFSRSLEAIDQQLYRRQYPELLGTKLVPISGNVPAGASKYTYRSAQEIGRAKVSANLTNDAPRVDVVAREDSSPIVHITDAYGYSLQDMEAAQLTGIPIDEVRAVTARDAIARAVNTLLLLGDADLGVVGLYKSAAVQSVSVVTGTWSTATADQILGDLQALERDVMTDTKGVEAPDTLVMPPSLYARATFARLSNTEITALMFFLRHSRSVKNVEIDPLLETAGASGVARLVLYTRKPEKVTGILPIEFQQLPPQAKAFEFEIPCRASCGGAVIRYPGSMAYMDGC